MNFLLRDFLSTKAMPKIFAAVPGSNLLFTTKEALAKQISEKKLRFIIAHEISHLQTDNLSPSLYGNAIIKKMSAPLFWGAVIAAGLSIFGGSIPLTLGMAAGKAFGALIVIKLAAEAAVNYGTRVIERRADRNALYVTRDLDGAQKTMDWLHEPAQKQEYSLLRESMQTHPSYTRRMDALRESFNAVSKYPVLQPANDNAAKGPEQKSSARRTNAFDL
jgi:Zn-dependent protease with chaperone function